MLPSSGALSHQVAHLHKDVGMGTICALFQQEFELPQAAMNVSHQDHTFATRDTLRHYSMQLVR